MPRPFPKIANLTADHAVVAQFVEDLDQVDAFQSSLEPWRWTIPVLLARQAGTLTRAQACLLQDIVISSLRIPNRDDQWAIFAVTEVFPSLRLDGLTLNTLHWIMSHTAALRRNVFGNIIKNQGVLLGAIITRKAQLVAQTENQAARYLQWLDRVGERLAPFIRR